MSWLSFLMNSVLSLNDVFISAKSCANFSLLTELNHEVDSMENPKRKSTNFQDIRDLPNEIRQRWNVHTAFFITAEVHNKRLQSTDHGRSAKIN